MDATITNLGSTSPDDDVYLSGPAVSLAAGASMVWPGVTTADLDAATWLKTLIDTGKVSVSLALEALDAEVALQGSLSPHKLPRYTVATLPTGANAVNGMVAYATNGRSGAEGVGAGTGAPVIFSNAQWRRWEDMAIVAA